MRLDVIFFSQETPTRTLLKPKGDIVSDTVYSDQLDLVPK